MDYSILTIKELLVKLPVLVMTLMQELIKLLI